MITSMTGYGRGEAKSGGIAVSVELRSVNGRYLEVLTRLPRSLALREGDIREIVRRSIVRGKVNVNIAVERDGNGDSPVRVDIASARAHHKLLKDLRKAVGLRQQVRLEHLLQFSEIFEPRELENTDEKEWEVAEKAVTGAVSALARMRRKEGGELERDFRERLVVLSGMVDRIESLSKEQVPRERARLRERIAQILDRDPIDEGRLEMELAILAERLDVTEECVRFRSHVRFFGEAMPAPEPAGRKLNFLVQEMNREINTMGSKSNDTAIAHIVVQAKEELEKVREQLQNIE